MSTKEKELQRSAELYIKINETQGAYFALSFLYYCQHFNDTSDVKRILEILLESDQGLRT